MQSDFDGIMELAKKVDFQADCVNGSWGFKRLGEGKFEITYKDNMVVRCEDHQIVDAAWGYVFDNTHLYQVLRSVLEQIPGVRLDAKTIQTDDCLIALGYVDGSVYIGEVPGCEGLDLIYERAWVASRENKENPETRDYVVYWDQGNSWCSVAHEIIGVTPEKFVEKIKAEISKSKLEPPHTALTEEEQRALDNYCWHLADNSDEVRETWNDKMPVSEDGFYKEMEKNSFRLSEEAIQIGKEIAATAKEGFWMMDRAFAKSSLSEDVVALLSKFREAVLEKSPNVGFVAEYCPEQQAFLVYDFGDFFIAIITKDACYHKEDFAEMMKAQGLEATEQNFKQLWAKLERHILKEGSLEKGALAAISEVVFEKNAELDKKKRSLAEIMADAGNRVSESQTDLKQKESNIER